jgi:hypothetical protein
MSNAILPGTILRDAWCRVRLDQIRIVVQATIRELTEMDRQDLDLEAPPSDAVADQVTLTATLAALEDCTLELREESGIVLDHVGTPCARYTEDPAWMEHYELAKLRYLHAASAALKLSLGGEPFARPLPSVVAPPTKTRSVASNPPRAV